jgi:hypothetical protein
MLILRLDGLNPQTTVDCTSRASKEEKKWYSANSPNDISPNDVSPNDVSPNDISPNDVSPKDILGETSFWETLLGGRTWYQKSVLCCRIK